MLSETLLAPSGDLLAEQDWQVTSARLRAQIDAIGTDATTADTCWTSAVTAANAQFRDLARAARNAAGLRGLPAQLRMDAVRVWSAARRSTRTVIRKGASLMRTAGPRANGMVQTARAVWRRLRAG